MIYRFFIIFILCTFYASLSHAMKYSNMGIVDDGIAKAIRSPKPLSVTQVLEDIKAKSDIRNIEKFDFSGNNISINGATQIFNFVADNIPNLHRLNLSGNKIYEEAIKDSHFTEGLKRVLTLSTFDEIDLRGDGIGTLSLLQQMASEVDVQIKKSELSDIHKENA